MKYDYMELGSTPTDENCVGVSKNEDYMPAMKTELMRFMAQLVARFEPITPEGAYFAVKWSHHDFGRYGDIVVKWLIDDEEAEKFAFFVEGNLPNKWSDTTVFHTIT